MRRYWLPASAFQTDTVVIDGEPFHHIFDVCRQEKGSKFEVLGLPGEARLIEVTHMGKRNAIGRVIETRIVPPLPKPHLVLALSIPRYPTMDSVVERAVEMGVAEIRPFFSEYSFVRKASSLPDSKFERWGKIIVSATQQSGRGDLMPLQAPVDFEDLLTEMHRRPQASGLFAYEGASQMAIRDFTKSLPVTAQEIWIFVGSEGGFSASEISKIQDLGLVPVTLGDQVLRVETACIALVSILKYEFGLMATLGGG